MIRLILSSTIMVISYWVCVYLIDKLDQMVRFNQAKDMMNKYTKDNL
jgi:hypothetical protein